MEKTESVKHSHHPRGVMDAKYHQDRLKSPGPSYRWKRRGWEAARVIQTYAPANPRILDLGTADGLLLDLVCEKVQPALAVGIDLSWELLQANTRKQPVIRGDVQELPLPTASFDCVIATAIIEHVSDPTQFMREIRRVLKPSGICIITTPVPVFEEIASKLGFLKEEDHQETFTLEKVVELARRHRFEILEAEKFMMSPIGFPFELHIERVMKKIGLSILLLNQLVAGRKLQFPAH